MQQLARVDKNKGGGTTRGKCEGGGEGGGKGADNDDDDKAIGGDNDVHHPKGPRITLE